MRSTARKIRCGNYMAMRSASRSCALFFPHRLHLDPARLAGDSHLRFLARDVFLGQIKTEGSLTSEMVAWLPDYKHASYW